MASPDLTARLRYLNDSAHLLAVTAPTTSKYLMAKRNLLMLDNDIQQSDSHRRKVCGACGTIMISNLDGKLEVESRRARRGKSTSTKAAIRRAKTMAYKCEYCGRMTRFNISPSTSSVPKRKSISLLDPKHSPSMPQVSNASSLVETPVKSDTSSIPTAASSTKKRTRSKKQGGLAAILARQKATDARGSSGFGLDLLDFIKKA